jgi:DNA ligase-1
MAKHPTLFKKASGGALQEWTISTEGNVIVTRWGQRGGAIQETRDEVKKGKNAGKKNETTPVQQAEAEALAKWEKQLKKGYVKTVKEAEAGTVDEIIEGGIAPMLAHRFDEHGHKIEFPAFAQPKFDGHRCIAVVKDGKASLWSRTRKPITGLPHINKAVEAVAKASKIRDLVLDGELYNHAYHKNFEELSSFIRNPEPKEGFEVVQYHIYDMPDALSQRERLAQLKAVIVDGEGSGPLREHLSEGPLKAVETIEVADEDDMMAAFDRFLDQGYEGLMIRNFAGGYVNKRSYDLQKVKEFMDAEFKIVGVEEGRGKLAGKAIFICETEAKAYPNGKNTFTPPAGVRFNVKMKGKLADLKKYIDDPSLAIGRLLNVQYQGFTNKKFVPRFPVGVRFHEEV